MIAKLCLFIVLFVLCVRDWEASRWSKLERELPCLALSQPARKQTHSFEQLHTVVLNCGTLLPSYGKNLGFICTLKPLILILVLVFSLQVCLARISCPLEAANVLQTSVALERELSRVSFDLTSFELIFCLPVTHIKRN